MPLSIQKAEQNRMFLPSKISSVPNIHLTKNEKTAARMDRLELSLPQSAQQDDLLSQIQRNEQRQNESRQQIETAKQEAESDAEEAKAMLLCLKISMRILAGDIVPAEDEQYLRDHNIKLYTLAINARAAKEDPEEYPSLLEEESDSDKLKDMLASAVSGSESPALALQSEKLEEISL